MSASLSSAAAPGRCRPIVDADMDSLFVLPLHIIPFRTEMLARARLVKNSRLEGVLELYATEITGSGQIGIDDAPRFLDWHGEEGLADLKVLETLAPLPSYDVYSLRRSLREHGIPVNDYAALKLTDEKNRELAGHMSRFTLPLIKQVYGDLGQDVTRFEDLVALFKDPDVSRALARLRTMADKLQIKMERIPRFIEDYGDIFMSLSYYNHCLDRVTPLVDSFVAATEEMRTSFQVRNDQRLMAEMTRIEQLLVGLVSFVKRTLAAFNAMSHQMWENLTATRFDEVRSFVEGTQAAVGGVLCGLTVKLNAWVVRFPTPSGGKPASRAEFLMTEMRHGLSGIRAIARGKSRGTSFGKTSRGADAAPELWQSRARRGIAEDPSTSVPPRAASLLAYRKNGVTPPGLVVRSLQRPL